jgi:hypothetical protein
VEALAKANGGVLSFSTVSNILGALAGTRSQKEYYYCSK